MLMAIVRNDVIVDIGDYRDLFPNTSFPANGPSADWMRDNFCVYVTVWKPHDSETQKLIASEPYLENNQVFTVVVADKTQEDKDADAASKAATIRAKRDRLLQESDWLVIKSYELNQNIPGIWEVYRQALRDIPQQPGFPSTVNFPSKPE